MTTIADPRYPIGTFTYEGPATPEARAAWIDRIAALPARLRAAVEGLDDAQLDTPYREGGWTLRQIAHHVADSHSYGVIRTRHALTEDRPAVTPYHQDRWGELADARTAPVELSVRLLEALHGRWVTLLRALEPAQLERAVAHPEHPDGLSVERILALYAWHGDHHVTQIEQARERITRR